MKSPERGTPFLGELLPVPGVEDPDTAVRMLAASPNKIVRMEPLSYDGTGGERDLKEFADAREYFYHLRDAYDIAVPNIDMILGHDPSGAKTVFVILDKIESAGHPEAAAEEFDAYYEKLIRAQLDAYRAHETFWVDYNSHQHLYGHRAGETKDRVYIVDIEPLLWKPEDPHYEGSRIVMMRAEIEKLVKFMAIDEQHISPTTRFVRARERFEELKAAVEKKDDAA